MAPCAFDAPQVGYRNPSFFHLLMSRQDLVIVFVIFGMDHLRFPVAVNTPFHGQWRELIDLFHLSYRTVASIAYRFIGFQPLCLADRGFSHGNMLGMIKVGKDRKSVV